MSELYVSTDIEANGPIPGEHSMYSIGSAMFQSDGILLGTYSANLGELEGAKEDPSTMDWWKTQPLAYAACRKDTRPAEDVMIEYANWLASFKSKLVFVGYPVTYDFMFVYWYLMKFTGKRPFSFSGLDIKTLAMAVLNKPYHESTKKNMPKHWFSKSKHNHVAVDDAIEQGNLFFNILKDMKGQPNEII